MNEDFPQFFCFDSIFSGNTIKNKQKGVGFMKKVIILGDDSRGLLTRTVVSACTAYGGALVIDSSGLYETSEKPDFMVLCREHISGIGCNGVIVFGEGDRGCCPDLKASGCIAVADSGCRRILSSLIESGITVIGCSSSGRDTLTLSCRSAGRVILSLQRTVRTASGKVIDPSEIEVRCPEEIPLYPVCAAACVLLLNDVPYEKGYLFETP